jgi:hypothetical protein
MVGPEVVVGGAEILSRHPRFPTLHFVKDGKPLFVLVAGEKQILPFHFVQGQNDSVSI